MNELVCLQNCRSKLWRIVAGTTSYDTGGNKVTIGITYRCHFGPAMPQKTFIAAPLDIMLTGMMRFQTGRIDYAGRTLTETALFLGVSKNAV